MADYTEYYMHCPSDAEYISGDYRSEYCQKLFQEADVVVTNPPFSLFGDMIDTLEKYELKYTILGNKNSITYKNVFKLIKANKLTLGYNSPKDYIQPNSNKKMAGLTRWFTNFDIGIKKPFLILTQKYDPSAYKKYDNYDAIEVSKVKDIPMDYNGVMGVPITFLDKYNPEQFEIVGSFNASSITEKAQEGYVLSTDTPTMIDGKEKMWNGPVIDKKPLYKRIVIRRKPTT